VRVLVIGRQAGAPPPGLPERSSEAAYILTDDSETVRRHLPGTEVVFHYGEPKEALRDAWERSGDLRWVHVGGVGVDWALFPDLMASDVSVTNSRGIFDVTLPEYVLTMMLALSKDLPGTVRAQQQGEWQHRLLEPMAGQRVVILGAGTIARSTARLLRAMGMTVTLVGRSERTDGSDEERVRAVADMHLLLPDADWLIALVPLTGSTRGLIGAPELARLPRGARLVNVGRGPVVVESALVAALRSGHLGGAALDVFETEPLPRESPLWAMPNVIVSPHIGGDVADTPAALTRAFLANLRRYLAGEPLQDVVDKRLGFVPTAR
jgi:phosphoglycerate dehydrogenase-like enzyme